MATTTRRWLPIVAGIAVLVVFVGIGAIAISVAYFSEHTHDGARHRRRPGGDDVRPGQGPLRRPAAGRRVRRPAPARATSRASPPARTRAPSPRCTCWRGIPTSVRWPRWRCRCGCCGSSRARLNSAPTWPASMTMASGWRWRTSSATGQACSSTSRRRRASASSFRHNSRPRGATGRAGLRVRRRWRNGAARRGSVGTPAADLPDRRPPADGRHDHAREACASHRHRAGGGRRPRGGPGRGAAARRVGSGRLRCRLSRRRPGRRRRRPRRPGVRIPASPRLPVGRPRLQQPRRAP